MCTFQLKSSISDSASIVSHFKNETKGVSTSRSFMSEVEALDEHGADSLYFQVQRFEVDFNEVEAGFRRDLV